MSNSGKSKKDLLAEIDLLKKKLKQQSKSKNIDSRYHSAFEEAADSIVFIDLKGYIVEVNKAFCKLLSYRRDELIGYKLRDCFDPSDIRKKPLKLKELQKDKKSLVIERVFIDSKGAKVETEINYKKVGDNEILGIVRDIGERKKLHRAFLENQVKSRILQEQNPAVVWTTDKDLQFSTYSSNGKNLKKFIGKSIHSLYPDKPKNYDPIVYHGKALKGIPVRFIHTDDEKIFESVLEPLKDTDQSIVGVLGCSFDITEKVKQREKLERSEELFRMMAENYDDVVFKIRFTPDGFKYDYISPSIKKLTGYNVSDFYNDPLLSYRMIHDEDKHLATVKLGKLKPGQRKVSKIVSNRLLTKEGKVVYVETLNNFFLDEKGNFLEIVGVTRDITERRESEKAIRRSEERFKKIADASLEGIVIHENGIIVDVNKAFCDLLEYSHEEIIGSSVLNYVVDEYKSVLIENIKNRVVDTYEVIGISKTGRRIFAELTPREIIQEDRIVRIATVRDISLKRIHEQALKESEEQYRFLFEKSPLPMWLYDSETLRIVNVNDAAVKHYGYTKEEFANLTVLDIRPPSERTRFTSHLADRKPQEKEDDYIGRWKHQKKDGSEIEVEITKGPLFISGKKYNLVVISDLSERVKHDKLLKESEERFRMLAENAIDIVYRYQVYPEPKYEYVSQSVYRQTGYRPEDFYEDPYLGFKIVHPDDQEFLQESQEVLQSGEEIFKLKETNTVLRWVKKSGEVVWTETRNRPVADEQGRLIYIEGITRNITERVELEKELIQSRETYKSLLETIPAGILIFNGASIVYANPAAFQIFGFDSPEHQRVEGLSIFEYILPEYHNRIILANQRVMQGEVFPFLEIKARRIDGEIIDLETRSVLINYKGTESIQAIFHDITYRKRIEQSIRESEERFRLLSEVSLEGIIFMDDIGKITDCNDRFLELFGLNDRVSAYGKTLSQLIGCRKELVPMLLNQTDEIFECSAYKQGKELFAEFKSNIIPFYTEKRFAVVIKDITNRKLYETEIDRSRKFYKELIMSSPDGILIYRDFKIVIINPAAAKIFDTVSEKLIGVDVRDLAPKHLHEFFTERRAMAERGEEVGFAEITITPKKGVTKTVETKTIKVDFEGDSSVMVVIHDLSDKKQLIREQLRAQIAEETNSRLQEEIRNHEKTQRKLQENQKFTRRIIESSLDIICAANNEGVITEFNRAAQQTFGYTLEEVIGKPIEILYADETEKVDVAGAIAKDGQFKGEVLNRKKNGEVFLAYLTASALLDDNGQLIGSMGVSRDITKTKMAENALRLSEEKYRAIYNQVFVGIAMVDLSGHFIQANQQLCRILGYTEDELREKTFIDVTYPADIDRSVSYRLKAISGEIEFFTFEKRYLHKSGAIVTAILTSKIVKNEYGEPDYFLSVFQDITNQRKVEEQVKIQSAKLNSIFESSTHLIWTIDKNTCLTSFNKNFANHISDIYGVMPYNGMSINTGRLVSTAEYNDFWNRKYEDTFNGFPQHFETNLRDIDGGTRWWEMYLNPIYDAQNRVVEVSGIGHDITEKKITEEKIRSSLREKEVLLKEVHHRVKNNLQVISSILNLQSSYVKDVNTLEMLRESQDRIKSMSFIHESLYQAKDFSQINFAEYIINLSKNLLHSYRVYDGQVRLDIEVDTVFMNLDFAIPSGLIINELVSNAFKYAFPQQRSGRVGIVMKQTGDTINLSIEDDGVGLPENVDFRNTESLGLQLVCTLVEQLNGEIRLDRSNGSKFIIWFNQSQKLV